MSAAAIQSNFDACVQDILRIAPEQDRLLGLKHLLGVIARNFGADAAILWALSPGKAPIDTKYLFVLADSFPVSGQTVFEYLGNESHTWKAAVLRQNIAEPVPESAAEFFGECGFRQMCSVPSDSPDSRAALTLYRKEDRPFLPEDVSTLGRVAQFVPMLYEGLRNKVGFNLLGDVQRGLHHGALDGRKDCRPSREWRHPALTQILQEVVKAFNALEASIYLVDPEPGDGKIHLAATEWPWGKHRQPSSYAKGYGATGYSFAEGRTVRIFNLARYHETEPEVQAGYPGLRWSDPIGLLNAAQAYFKVDSPRRIPPLCFLCVPIHDDNKVIGVLRCCGTRENPHYFDDRHVQILELVADQLGEWWGHYLRLRAWEFFLERLRKLNQVVNRELSKPEPVVESIYQETMKCALELIPEADNASVRMAKDESALQIESWYGDRWRRGSWSEQSARRSHAMPLKGDSAGADVYLTNQSIAFDVTPDGPYRTEIFPEVTGMIIAPISFGHQKLGVLDLRFVENRNWLARSHSQPMLDVLGAQLGVYTILAARINDLHQTQKKLRIAIDQQHEVYRHLRHQIKTPAIHAHAAARQLMERSRQVVRASELQGVRFHCRRMEQIAHNLRLFVDLASGEKPLFTVQQLTHLNLMERLRAMVDDFDAQSDPDRRVRFRLNEDSFEPLHRLILFANVDLLEQMISNLLDNAAKYSFDDTVVRVSGGLTQKQNHFWISVKSQGLQISSGDRPRLTEKYFRTEAAQLTVADGSGIGLWIVDELIKAHGGFLHVPETDANDNNDFRLNLPIRR
jgi:signal transduction histidine kinase